MEYNMVEIAQRIKGLRLMLDLSVDDMAKATEISVSKYELYETGTCDFPFSFLHACAKRFEVDVIELLVGEAPRLNFYEVVRAGKGLPIHRREDFTYLHMAYMFKNKVCEPLMVTAPYSEKAQNEPIALSSHPGQEFDLVIKGQLTVNVEGHIEVLNEGDVIYFDSSYKHGMIASGGQDCVFLAAVLKA